jgi:putative transposase
VSAFIDEHRARLGVQPICEVLGVSASAYYHRASGPRSARAIEDERLLALIRVVHKDNYEAYGYRRCWKELLRRGHTGVPRCQVQRLMAEHAIRGAKRRGRPWRTTTCDPEALERPDLVNRDFTATQPGELLIADFTYVRCWQGTVFFAFVLDASTAGGSSAGSSRGTCAPSWSSTRCRWPLGPVSASSMSSSCITPIAAPSPGSTGPRNSVC